jgi:hypothetical protein
MVTPGPVLSGCASTLFLVSLFLMPPLFFDGTTVLENGVFAAKKRFLVDKDAVVCYLEKEKMTFPFSQPIFQCLPQHHNNTRRHIE